MKQLICLCVPILFVFTSCQKAVTFSNPQPADSLRLTLPALTWSTLLGGTSSDDSYSIAVAADGNYYVAGVTDSNDGDVIGNHGATDALVIKLDKNGKKVWSKTYGGTDRDEIFSIISTPDGGVIAVGFSMSSDGDLSGNIGANAWLLKLDAGGNKIWSKAFGGSRVDYAISMIATSDGGVLVAGYTESTNGDITGNHGNFDAWALKVDASGNKLWSKVYGGTAFDYVQSISATADGGFLLIGNSKSNNGDITGNSGDSDIWALKLDSVGNMIWSKLFGDKSYDYGYGIAATSDGGCLVSGTTHNYVSTVNQNDMQTLLFKLDANGNKIWEKKYTDLQDDMVSSIIATADGGGIFAGTANSNNGELGPNHGFGDAWLTKLDKNGNKVWSRLYGGAGEDLANCVKATADGGIVVAGTSGSPDGDFTGFHGGHFDIFAMKIKL